MKKYISQITRIVTDYFLCESVTSVRNKMMNRIVVAQVSNLRGEAVNWKQGAMNRITDAR